MPRPPSTPAALRTRFDLSGPLGVGARGQVWSATHRDTGHTCAIKTLQRPTPADTAVLKAEYRSLVRCQHPHVVGVDRLIVRPTASWFEMALVGGTRIDRWARELPGEWNEQVERRFRQVAGQLVSAVQRVHQCGLVHRDLKPENLLVRPDDHLVLLDFDLAAPPSAEQTRGSILGTPGYRPPEQALGLPIGPAADWYAVGAVLHELLLGQPPFGRRPRASLRAQRRRRPPDLHAVRPDLPGDIARLVRDLLQAEPSARPAPHVLQAAFPSTEPPAAEPSRSTIGDVHRALQGPAPAWVELTGSTTATRRATIRAALSGPGPMVVVRIDPREDLPRRLLDATAGAVVQLLRRLPRDRRTAVLPRDRIGLASAFPDFVLLPELASYAPTDGSGQPAPLARILQRLSLQGGVKLVFEDIHLATPGDLDDLHALLQHPIGCTVMIEGEPVADPRLRARLRTLAGSCLAQRTVRVRPRSTSL